VGSRELRLTKNERGDLGENISVRGNRATTVNGKGRGDKQKLNLRINWPSERIRKCNGLFSKEEGSGKKRVY